MFRNRYAYWIPHLTAQKNSQKPDEELYNSFKRSFPELCPDGSSASPEQKPQMLEGAILAPSLALRTEMETDDRKPGDQLVNGVQDQWGLTPSLMDPNSVAFSTFASQPPAYYTGTTPTAVGLGMTGITGDLRTPGISMSSLTALPHTTAQDAANIMRTSLSMNMNGFQPTAFGEPMQTSFDPAYVQPTAYVPGTFLSRESDYGILEHSAPEVHPAINRMPNLLNNLPLGVLRQQQHHQDSIEDFDAINDPNHENFRFHVTLRAATAMIKEPDEIPVTYLNKGQAYTVTIVDSDPLKSGAKPTSYRTYIRISFEEEEQRSKPASCWQLWKEGRGANEAHQRNGKLLAVEHVDPNQGGDGEPRHTQLQLQRACFDGFSVIWTPNRLNGRAECAISVRFNFLSTDFSHSKGVKGIPVRLCAKTEVLTSSGPEPPSDSPEVCYCKVKLFRDHGAERKLSNDITHVKKMIDKYRNQIAQAEAGSAGLDKRKRNGSLPKPSKSFKHKRSWSIGESGKPSLEEDLQMKLDSLQEMFSSTRPVSHLNLIGDPQDDPDLYPVQFLDGDTNGIMNGVRDSSDGNQVISPTASHQSYASSLRSFEPGGSNNANQSSVYDDSRHGSLDFSGGHSQNDSGESQSGNRPRLIRVNPGGVDRDSFDAMDVDLSYDPPPESLKRQKACCFYIRPQAVAGQKSNGYYRAIYLNERSVQDLTYQVAKKCRFDPCKIVRVARIHKNGLRIAVDDDVVDQIPEGQDMVVEFSEVRNSPSDSVEVGSLSPTSTSGLEMRLIY